MSEGSLIVVIGFALAAKLTITIGLTAWGRWVTRRHAGGALWRRAAWMPWISFALSSLGVIVSGILLARAFGVVAAADPASKATMLAQRISEAMNVAGFTLVPANALLLASVVVFAIGSFLKPTAGASG